LVSDRPPLLPKQHAVPKEGEIGLRANYEVWIAPNEQPKIEQTLKEQIEKKLSLELPPENLARIQEIDVIWIKSGVAEFEFEVENTTAITEAIVRGSNIIGDRTTRVIVIPEERKNLLYRKVNEPALKERIEKDRWMYIYYKDAESFYEQFKSRKKIDLLKFEQTIRRLSKVKIGEQQTLSKYA
jgi:hypothetical protein